MKRIYLFIVLTLVLGTLISSCGYKARNPSNSDEESNINIDDIDSIQESRKLMLDWQIKKTYQEFDLSYNEKESALPITESQAEMYISQKGLLLNNKEYKEKLGFDFSIPESKEETALLDELHQHLSYWMLMRENMRVLNTEKENDEFYSMVLTSGYDFLDGIYLVHYIVQNEEVEIINVFDAPQISSLQNVYLGVVNQDNPICFGFSKQLKYDSDEDTWVDSDISKINLITNDGDYKVELDNSKSFIAFLSKESQVVGYKAMNSLGDSIEEKELTELDLSYLLER